MLKSMTGFARAEVSSKLGKLNLEISSINKRFLETNIYLPKILLFFEQEIKKEVEKMISRGQVSLRFEFFPNEENMELLLPNILFLKNLKLGWEKLAKQLGYKNEEISLEFLLSQTRYLPDEKIKDIAGFKKLLLETLGIALNSIIIMKKKEGKTLSADLEKRLLKINKELVLINKRVPITKKIYEEKLKAKFEEILKDKEFFEDRLLKEAAIFADKIDVTEEIIRLDSHIKQFLSMIKAKEDIIGRKLDFLMQECLREVNTIGSKASDVFISKKVIDIKAELEKIKEQIQNIE